MRKLKHLMEAGALFLVMAFFRALPLDAASALGGWLGRRIGPMLRQTQVAKRNLAFAFPEKSEAEREAICGRMWDHLGRVLAEFAHLPGNKLFACMSFSGLHHLPPPGKPVLFVSGHFGNWELLAPSACLYGVPVTMVYRHINNPYVDRFIARRRARYTSGMLPKGPRGALRLARALRAKESLALLVDQKMNEGISVPFFGREAMTAPAVAQLALRFTMPIIPTRVVRTHGAHFQATAYPPLAISRTGDEAADIRAILLELNRLLEGWIREYPEQWFWIHRRFAKECYE